MNRDKPKTLQEILKKIPGLAAGGAFIGLITMPPFLAVLDFFVPNGNFTFETVYYKWMGTCAVLTCLFFWNREIN